MGACGQRRGALRVKATRSSGTSLWGAHGVTADRGQVVEGLESPIKRVDLYSVDNAGSIKLPIFERGINATVFPEPPSAPPATGSSRWWWWGHQEVCDRG